MAALRPPEAEKAPERPASGGYLDVWQLHDTTTFAGLSILKLMFVRFQKEVHDVPA